MQKLLPNRDVGLFAARDQPYVEFESLSARQRDLLTRFSATVTNATGKMIVLDASGTPLSRNLAIIGAKSEAILGTRLNGGR